MSFALPTLEDLRKQNRDHITARLASGPMVPNSALRIMSDANAGLAFLTILYLQWLSEQFLPDTADAEWLDRHAQIWLGGRKAASYAEGFAAVTGAGEIASVLPAGTQVSATTDDGSFLFETTEDRTITGTATNVPVKALLPGPGSNLPDGTTMALAISGIGEATALSVTGGADVETDEELRDRVLFRIRKPPMGGDADDYVAWALEVPGVTRAWCAPNEMGIGTVTVRIMCDELRATSDVMTNGFPLSGDIEAVRAHLDTKRPVCVKDFFVEAPIPEPVSFTISNLVNDDASTRENIRQSVIAMLADRASPGFARNGVLQDAQTIYAAWVSEAIMQAAGVEHFDLAMTDHVMPNGGALAVLGTITFS